MALATISWNPEGYIAEILEEEESGKKEVFAEIEKAKQWVEDIFGLRPVYLCDDYGLEDDFKGGKGAIGM